jgi:hypothetical protein
MKSQWFEYKAQAIQLRSEGLSIREIEKLLSIPRSTLSGWLKSVELTELQKARLQQNADLALIKARVKASDWHRSQKKLRLKKAEEQATVVLEEIVIDDNIIELALAMLYLGEGAKKNTTAIGNSNPLILKFFITILIKKYGVSVDKIKCDLHIRADQNTKELIDYWSHELNLPMSCFRSVIVDVRTTGRTSYPEYKGMCLVNCGNIAIQRKLIYLYNLFCQKVIEKMGD